MLKRFRRAGRAALVAGAVLPLTVFSQGAHGVADFEAAGQDARKLQLAPGFKLDVWAAEPMLANGVAFSLQATPPATPAGPPTLQCYVAESHRWANSIFDITQKTNWLLADMAFQSVADRAAFLAREYATNLTVLTRDSELVRLVEDRDGDQRADHTSVYATGFNSTVDGTAAGVLALGTEVWFANIPNLWKLSGTPMREGEAHPPTTASARTAIASGIGVHIGVSGHDLHGLIRGPDGRIYVSFGDRGVSLTNREGAVIHVPDCGGVLRCEPDGRNLELYCMGLRNPQELAFDDLGNLWTSDNDTAGADPCRLLHLVEGGDYGWRTSYQHMENFGPWVGEEMWRGGKDGILPLAGTVSQGPSGLAYYPGTGFGDRFAGRFLHCDFPGGVVEFTVKPLGATYVLDRKEKFLWNCWPTDVDFGPDGAVYVLDWVAGWGRPQKGRIYRIAPTDPAGAETLRLLAEDASQRTVSRLAELLAHPNRNVRLQAQWELARRGTASLEVLAAIALKPGVTPARLHALWGTGQIVRDASAAGSGLIAESLERLLPLTGDSDPEVRGQAAALLGSLGFANLRTELKTLFADPEPRVRFLAAHGLALGLRHGGFWKPGVKAEVAGKLARLAIARGAPREVWEPLANATHGAPLIPFESTLEAAARVHPDDPFGLFPFVALLEASGRLPAGAREATWIARATVHESPVVRHAALLAMRRLSLPALTNFLRDPDPRLVEEAGRAIHDAPIASGFPALASFITKIDCPTGLYSRAIDAAYRLGTQQHAQMLAGFAARRDVPDTTRALALRALADWEKPSPLDRVNGLWRPLVVFATAAPTDGTPLPAASSNPLLDRASQAARNLGRAAAVPVLPPDLGRSTPYEAGMAVRRNPAPAQRAFLRVAGELMNPNLPSEAGVVLTAKDSATVQLAAIEAAVRLRTKEASTPLFEKFTDTNSLPEVRRAIVPALAALNAATAPEAVRIALTSTDAALRASAVPHLDRLDGDEGINLLVRLAGDERGELASRQAAWRTIAPRLRRGPAESGSALFTQALGESLDRWASGTLPAGLQLEILDAADASPDPAQRTRAATLRNGPAAGDRLAAHRPVLAGGRAEAGRRIFFDKPETQCSRCHAIAGNGGTVGPALDGVGKRLKREEILESILDPNARLAPGFENVVLTLKNGTALSGTVKREGNGELLLLAGEDGEITVKAADIASRERGLSAMPEGLGAMLTPFELRDLLEYLASLR